MPGKEYASPGVPIVRDFKAAEKEARQRFQQARARRRVASAPGRVAGTPVRREHSAWSVQARLRLAKAESL
jgi:hypothetical protein